MRHVVVVGALDGIHLGHQALLVRARREAEKRDASAIALTFWPHPSAVLGNPNAMLIASPRRQHELLAAAGIMVKTIPFTEGLASMAPAQFVRDVFVAQLGAVAVVAGADWRFGCNRSGTLQDVTTYGIEAVPCDDVLVGGRRCSSTWIREALAAGDLAMAERLLGRRYDLDGVVAHGHKRGRTIGYPTANVVTDINTLLPSGIYATRVCVDGQWFGAATSLGTNPTFGGGAPRTLEAYLLDFSGDIYGQCVRVEFVARLRDEQAFASVEALVGQIGRDVQETVRVLLNHSESGRTKTP